MIRHMVTVLFMIGLAGGALGDDRGLIFPGRAFRVDLGGKGMVVADLDRDGYMDVTVTGGGEVTVAWGDADGALVELRTYRVGNAEGIAAGDLGSPSSGEPDGIMDLLVLRRWNIGFNGGITVLYGVPDRGFVSVDVFLGFGHQVSSAGPVIGDFDGDGYNDFGFSLRSGYYVAYGGPTGFTEYVLIPIGASACCPAASADLNSDGRGDLVLCASRNDGTQQLSILYGQPNREFVREEHRLDGNCYRASLADFDGDGVLDVALTSWNPDNAIFVFYPLPDGGFTETPVTYYPGLLMSSAGPMAGGDLDGDGRDDLIVCEAEGVCGGGSHRWRCVVLYGRSSQRLSDPVPFVTGYPTNQLAVADTDGDGRGEVFFSTVAGPARVAIHRSHPRGVIATAKEIHITRSIPVDMVTADLNADGKQDLAIVDQYNNGVMLLWGSGSGGFEQAPAELPVPGTPRHIVAADLDGDDLLDLAITNDTPALMVYRGNEAGQFPDPPEQVPVGNEQSLIVGADFNNDGRTDIALLSGAQIVVLLGLPGGLLDAENPIVHPVPSATTAIAADHLDGDNWLDLAVSYPRDGDGKTLSVLYGEGDGSFGDPERYDTGWDSATIGAGITVGDINADGLVDLVTAYSRWDGVKVTLLLGQPGGGFALDNLTVDGPCVGDLYVDDFDRDGIGDIAIGTQGAQLILFGSKGGSVEVETFATPRYCSTVTAVADLNNDGRPDLVSASRFAHPCACCRGRWSVIATLNQSTAKIRGDLAVTDITAPSSGVCGEVVEVSWTVQNQLGDPITGLWTDAVYMSRDEYWDINDIKLGTLDFHGTLAPNGQDGDDYQPPEPFEVALPGVAPGPWYILVRTDATDAVAEDTGEIDNVMASPISMDLPELAVCPAHTPPPGCPGLNDEFTRQRRALYYKLEAVADKDLLVTLTCTSERIANELYIRYGAVPSRSNYDAKYETPFAASQTARVPGTEPGTYYILVYADHHPTEAPVPFNLRAEYMPLELDEVAPDYGGNTGQVTVTFTGSGFRPDIQVALRPWGGEEILPRRIFFYDTGSFAAIFDLDGQPETGCGLRLTNPGGEELELEDEFTIQQGLDLDISGRIRGPRRIRPPAKAEYKVHIYNNGNNDIPYLFVDVSFPPTYIQSIVIDKPDLIDPPPIEGIDWSEVDPTVEIDGRVHYPLLFRDYPVTPPVVIFGGSDPLPPPPDLEFTIIPKHDAPWGSGYDVKVGLSPMSLSGFLGFQYIAAGAIRLHVLETPEIDPSVLSLAEDASAWWDTYTAGLHLLGIIPDGIPFSLDHYASPRLPYRESREEEGVDWAWEIGWTAIGALAEVLAGGPVGFAVDVSKWFLEGVIAINEDRIANTDYVREAERELLTLNPHTWWVLTTEKAMRRRLGIETDITWPIDPNDKLSPNGYGEAGFVPHDYPIPYTIRFENLAAARAAALKVSVTDPVPPPDSSPGPFPPPLDWTTVTLEEIAFGGMVIEVPEGLSHYEGTVEFDGWMWNEADGWHRYDADEAPVMPLVMYVEAGLDTESGAVHWSIQCADVNTRYFPEDPYGGFLPPNQEELFYPDPDDLNDPPRMIHPGEGYLKFSVRPLPDLPTGTEIRNVAEIVFDWNAPMNTPEVLNTIDAGVPSSAVAPLPTEMPYAHFEVCWPGEDDPGGSGIENYTIYISDNDGPYAAWLTTEEECGWYTNARVGHTYRFYSVARDHIGHVEAPPTDPDDGSIIPDTTTTIAGLVGDFDGDDDLDPDDYFFLEICLSISGPGGDPGFQECVDTFDLDDKPDGDVDLQDFAVFQRAFTGVY